MYSISAHFFYPYEFFLIEIGVFIINTLLREYTIADIDAQADRVLEVIELARNKSLFPNVEKKPPTFSLAQVAEICRIDRSAFMRRMSKGDLPSGTEINSARRSFTLAEVRAWAKAYSRSYSRKRGDKAVVLAIGNSKGGVTKTTTAACVGQGLSLRGYKALAVDLDPQGSLTSLCGYSQISMLPKKILFFLFVRVTKHPCVMQLDQLIGTA